MKDTVIIYSGGMDSTVLLHEYKDSIKIALTFDYGSKHNAREHRAARANCGKLGIRHITLNLDFINGLWQSDLLRSGGEIARGVYDEDNIRRTVVPFRNAIMLSLATGLAESNGCKKVMLASHSGDHTIYPDCRKEFNDAMNEAMQKGTYIGVSLFAPYNALSKREIALRGKSLGVDFGLTYSCYRGGENHCGECSTCMERKQALNGFDPTVYEDANA